VSTAEFRVLAKEGGSVTTSTNIKKVYDVPARQNLLNKEKESTVLKKNRVDIMPESGTMLALSFQTDEIKTEWLEVMQDVLGVSEMTSHPRWSEFERKSLSPQKKNSMSPNLESSAELSDPSRCADEEAPPSSPHEEVSVDEEGPTLEASGKDLLTPVPDGPAPKEEKKSAKKEKKERKEAKKRKEEAEEKAREEEAERLAKEAEAKREEEAKVRKEAEEAEKETQEEAKKKMEEEAKAAAAKEKRSAARK
jgi:hypothetical protein